MAGALAFALAPLHANAAGAAADLPDFIVNLVRYAAWPADPTRKSLTICHAHGGSAHEDMPGSDRAILIRGLPVAWRAVSTPSQLGGCSAVWLHADVRPAPRDWLSAIGEQPVLTMSNYADFTADGGVIGAYRVGNDWRFEVNLEALQRSRINIAAAALRLSQKQKPATAGEVR